MRQLVFSMAVSLSLVCPADGTQASAVRPRLTPGQKAALLEKMQILKGGDMIAKPGTRRGAVMVVDAQKRAPREWLAAAVGCLAGDTRFGIVLKDGEYNSAAPAVVGDMTLYVIDNPSLPRIAVAPDDRWAYCNVARIYTDKRPFFEARTRKLVSRTFAMLCGGMSSTYGISLAGPMPEVDDLDVLPNERIPVDVTVRMKQYMEKFGVTPAVVKPYRIACQEGWAPAPTNDIQRAIWNKIHAVPNRPITIEFDPKRDTPGPKATRQSPPLPHSSRPAPAFTSGAGARREASSAGGKVTGPSSGRTRW